MKTRAKKNKLISTGRKPDLTKQVLIEAVTPAIRKASQKAMETLGYIVTVENNWVIKKYRDGKKEKISELAVPSIANIQLD